MIVRKIVLRRTGRVSVCTFLIFSPISLIVHCKMMLSGAQAPPLICFAVVLSIDKAYPCVTSFVSNIWRSLSWFTVPLWLPHCKPSLRSSCSGISFCGLSDTVHPFSSMCLVLDQRGWWRRMGSRSAVGRNSDQYSSWVPGDRACSVLSRLFLWLVSRLLLCDAASAEMLNWNGVSLKGGGVCLQ